LSGTGLEHAADDDYSPFKDGFLYRQRESMNNIIYIVGLVVIVIAVLSFFGLH
jgi:hypothetical protein